MTMIYRLAGFVVLCALLAGPAHAQQSTFENLTVDNTSGGVALAASTHTPASAPQQTYCVGKLETAQIRLRDDGTAPSTTVGTLVDIGDIVELNGNVFLRAVRFIRTGSTSGAIQFQCYPERP